MSWFKKRVDMFEAATEVDGDSNNPFTGMVFDEGFVKVPVVESAQGLTVVAEEDIADDSTNQPTDLPG